MGGTTHNEDKMAKKLEIYYKPPTYSRDNYPRFAHELVERIVDFLWDDPRAFAGCCLVCHAWYCATRPLFPTMADDHRFIHKESFMQYSRLLARPRYLPFFKVQIASLRLHGTFAHSWVMHIPLGLLPRLSLLVLWYADWVAINPQHFLLLELRFFRFRHALDLRRMINALPNLSEVVLDEIAFQHPSLGVHTVHPLRYSLSKFELNNVRSRRALLLLTLLNSRTCHQLREFVISLAGRPCAELIAHVTSILQITGAALEKFLWWHLHGEAFEAVPRLSANTSLEELDLALCLPSSPQIIQRALEALLSDITSPRLRRISLSIWLNQSKILQDANEVPVSPADTTKSIPTFHAVLSRGIYDRLPKNVRSRSRSDITIHTSLG
ncbi:uncharacterized protein B0H18DRAFT_1043617 [Fomitopsis serialis]|uniref:uncharacterized protein n=1 Tax=Fomitopsis serialis TaxID=139415 RepID=UPI0020082B9A|nr:uncharacterized protein B0H18DRAFT_1043617 [Neoantrodia serialis]KAH9914920.1 hypothetical protein B0H18DRAFT_1043617 [Neoantrodia serialis]